MSSFVGILFSPCSVPSRFLCFISPRLQCLQFPSTLKAIRCFVQDTGYNELYCFLLFKGRAPKLRGKNLQLRADDLTRDVRNDTRQSHMEASLLSGCTGQYRKSFFFFGIWCFWLGYPDYGRIHLNSDKEFDRACAGDHVWLRILPLR